MSASVARVLTAALGAAVAVVLALVVTSGSDDPYRVRLSLRDADGLREGSEVRMGGAVVGSVEKFKLGARDSVEAVLKLTKGDARVGRGASAAIRSSNLLGSKFVELAPGDRRVLAPSGVQIPVDRVRRPVDLDQVLNVLDADTRERLGILVNEAGTAFTGRRAEFSALLGRLPSTLDRATHFLGELTTQTTTLQELVEHSDRFVATLAPERRQLARLVTNAASTVDSTAARQREIADTLDRAPQTLRSLRGFLDKLRATAQPLGPAARSISASAPGLAATLRELHPFERAAAPALRAASRAAGRLDQLATEATPVVAAAKSPTDEVAMFVQRIKPIMDVLDVPGVGIDGIVSAAEGWARATQVRDGISHMFRGHLIISDDAIRSLVSRIQLATTIKKKPKSVDRRPSTPVTRPSSSPQQRPANPLQPTITAIKELPKRLVEAVQGLITPPKHAPESDRNALSTLADYLLGGSR